MLKRIILILFLFIAIIIVGVISFNSYLNNPSAISKKIKLQVEKTSVDKFLSYSDWLWNAGRSFTFEILCMNIFSPGSAELTVKGFESFDKQHTFLLEAKLQPNSFLTNMYNANMELTSVVFKGSKHPLRYEETSTTPEKVKTKVIIFDRIQNIAEREGIKYKIENDTQDPLSVFFNLLDTDYKIGEPVVLNLLSKEEIYEFKVVPVVLKDNIYKLEGEVYRQDRSSTHGAKFVMWIKDGAVRIPLLIRVVSAAGPIYLRLKSVE